MTKTPKLLRRIVQESRSRGRDVLKTLQARRAISAGIALCVAVMSLSAADIREDVERRALADGLFRRGLFGLAVAEYAALLRQYPEVLEQDVIYFRMGESLRREGRLDQAEQAFREVVERFPDSPFQPRAAFKRASLFLDLEQYEGAVELFEALLLNDPPEEWREASLYALAEGLNRLGREAEALSRVRLLLEAFPGGDYADHGRMLKGGILVRGDDDARVRALDLFAALAESAENARVAAEARYQQARLLNAMPDRAPEAAVAFLQLIREYPDDERVPEAQKPAAWACFRAERYADALERIEAALADGVPDSGELSQWLYLRANCERRLMQPARAVETYTQLLALPLDVALEQTARYELALTLHRQGNAAGALAAAARVVPDTPEREQDLLWLQAEAAAAVPDALRAVQFYRQLLNRFPDSPLAPDSLYRLGHHLQQQESWTEASRYYLRLAEGFPEHSLTPRALFASGLSLARAGRGEEALRDWSTLLNRFPTHATIPEALYQKALEEVRRQRRTDALATLDRLLRQAPDTPRKAEALFWRGVLLHETGELPEAETALRAALVADPAPSIAREARFVLGMNLHQKGREAEAADLFQPLLEASIRKEFSPDRLYWLSAFQFSRGAHTQAADAARTLLEVADTPAWREAGATLLGRALRGLDQPDAAAEAFRQALGIGAESPYAAEAALRLGEWELDQGRMDAAESMLQRAARLARDPDSLGLRAAAFTGLARTAAARQDFSTAIRYHLSIGLLFDDPEWVPPALDAAATLLLENRRREDAIATAQELIDRYPKHPLADQWVEQLKTLAPREDANEGNDTP